MQRYGLDVRGGAETHCRSFASRLANRGCDVEVFTTCATDYRTWRNVFPPGESEDSGVVVHRFPVIDERADDFDAICARVFADPRGVPREVQEDWMRKQGPQVPDLIDAIREDAGRFDLVVFVTYLYWTTYRGLPAARDRAVLHPTAHDEPPIYLSMFDDVFRMPRALVFLSAEERGFVRERFGIPQVPELVSGVGVQPSARADGDRGRELLGSERYALCLGRVDANKGIEHICSFFDAYRERRNDPIELVFVGDPVAELGERRGIRVVGTLNEQDKWDALAGAEVLIHPSFFESFALSLLEAWCLARPAVVNGFCDVTKSHCVRSGGGVWYRSYAEFESCMDRVLTDDALRYELGQHGKHYVETSYGWQRVLDRYSSFLERVRETI